MGLRGLDAGDGVEGQVKVGDEGFEFQQGFRRYILGSSMEGKGFGSRLYRLYRVYRHIGMSS